MISLIGVTLNFKDKEKWKNEDKDIDPFNTITLKGNIIVINNLINDYEYDIDEIESIKFYKKDLGGV